MKIISEKNYVVIQQKLAELDRLEREIHLIDMYCGEEFEIIRLCMIRLQRRQKEQASLYIYDWRENIRSKFQNMRK